MMRIYHHGMHNETRPWFQGVDFEYCILGKCFGIAFSRRAADDNHVMINWLVEDDELWHTPPSGGFDSFWVPDSLDVLTKAQKWLVDNCDPDPSGYGYVFRS